MPELCERIVCSGGGAIGAVDDSGIRRRTASYDRQGEILDVIKCYLTA